jgi:peptidoglycan hydrolase-like protein with peptidoglycan-binding domain
MKRSIVATRLMLLPVLAVGLGVSPCLLQGTPAAAVAAKKKPVVSSSRSGKSGGKSSKKSRREVGQKAPTTERVSEIQQALAKNGSYSGSPNGQWDGSTVDAMKKFQGSRGLNPSGKLDAKTLGQLGLGSKTAGIGAPTTPKVASANRLQREPLKAAVSEK